jgi:hypothetical protein
MAHKLFRWVTFGFLISTLWLSDFPLHAENSEPGSGKPKVWIYTDMSDPTLRGRERNGSVNDPDDVSAMAGYLLMANEFQTLGIVVSSTHRHEHRNSPDQAKWADDFIGAAYRAEVDARNEAIGGYPENLPFTQSCIKSNAEQFDPKESYESLKDYSTVQSLFDAAVAESDGQVINVLCWGSLTEPAILVKHCLTQGQGDILKKLRFIAHWTNSSLHQGSAEHPENVANCREDAEACSYLKSMAAAGEIVYHECGAIGQHGIVSGGPKGNEYFDQFKSSRLGKIFAEGKFVYSGVDHSDAATYWVLLGKHGVELSDIPSDGTIPPSVELRNEKAFESSSKQIHDELLRRSELGISSR